LLHTIVVIFFCSLPYLERIQLFGYPAASVFNKLSYYVLMTVQLWYTVQH